jgi:hypothetical protein
MTAKECEVCNLIASKEKETYFETEEVLIFKAGDNVYACPKEHKKSLEDKESSGLIKILMKILGKYYPNHFYSFKAHKNKEHICIYTVLK